MTTHKDRKEKPSGQECKCCCHIKRNSDWEQVMEAKQSGCKHCMKDCNQPPQPKQIKHHQYCQGSFDTPNGRKICEGECLPKPIYPQTGEGEMRKAVQVAAEKSTQEQVDVLREAGYFPPPAEEMEWEKEWESLSENLNRPIGSRAWLIREEQVEKDRKAFLRKHLSMQREEFLEMIGKDVPEHGEYGGTLWAWSVNQFKAELRSKLNVQKGKK